MDDYCTFGFLGQPKTPEQLKMMIDAVANPIREKLTETEMHRDALAGAIRSIFEAVPPYSMDGSPTIPDSTVELVIKAMKDAGQKWDWE